MELELGRGVFLSPIWQLMLRVFVGPSCYKHQRKAPNCAGNEDAAHGRILADLHILAIWAMGGSAPLGDGPK